MGAATGVRQVSDLTRRIDAIIGRLERLTTKLPAAVDALLDRRRKIDGWGNGGADNTRITYQAELTPTESPVAQREHCDVLMRNLYEELDAIRLIAGNLERDCDFYLRADLPDPGPKPRCDGGIGRTGYLEWGDPTCTNIPEPYRKQCSRCRKAEDRWLVAHGERRHIGEDV
jgi:hypothetical protein